MTTLLLALLLLIGLVAAQENSNCSCSFTVPAEVEAGCKVYGQLGNDILIPYNRASQDCLDQYNIRVRALEVDQVEQLCGPPVSVSAVTNFLRFDSSAASNALKSQLTMYFDAANEDGSVYTLRNNITSSDDGGSTMIDCVSSASDCWNVIRSYLTDNTQLLETMCDELYARLYNGYELEQSTVRIAICNAIVSGDDDPADTSCTDLREQISAIQASDQAPDACSAFGLGPAENDIPEFCVGGSGNNGTAVTDDDAGMDDAAAMGDDATREVSAASNPLRFGFLASLLFVCFR